VNFNRQEEPHEAHHRHHGAAVPPTGAAAAYATIPDWSGAVHGCYRPLCALRVIYLWGYVPTYGGDIEDLSSLRWGLGANQVPHGPFVAMAGATDNVQGGVLAAGARTFVLRLEPNPPTDYTATNLRLVVEVILLS